MTDHDKKLLWQDSNVSVYSPSELFHFSSIAGNVSGEAGEEGTAMEDQDGEPGTLGHYCLHTLISYIQTLANV